MSAGGRGDDQLVDFFVRASAFFGEQLRRVTDDDWERLTPCEGWDIRTLVAHVVIGDAQVPELLEGRPVPRVVEADRSILGSNPMAAWRGTALATIRAFAGRGVLGRRYDHPVGNVSGRTVIGFRINDSLVHGWDLATALGTDVVLDPEICEYLLDFWLPMASTLPESGYFAAALMPPEGADVATRLLALLGRRA